VALQTSQSVEIIGLPGSLWCLLDTQCGRDSE